MPTGISLHVGVNDTDPDCFGFERLSGCVNDAAAMYYVAKARNFNERLLLTDKQATYQNVAAAIQYAAGQLKGEGDVFFFTFAGHGAQVTDHDNEAFEGGDDEAMVLHDRLLLDDELHRRYWPKFNSGVRIILVTDSCNNGTLLALAPAVTEISVGGSVAVAGGLMSVTTEVMVATTETFSSNGPRRQLSDEARQMHVRKFSEFYQNLMSTLPAAPDIKASVFHLAACPDGFETPDGPTHGVFTQALLDVWDNGSFNGTYEEFSERIGQRPALAELGGPRPFIELERGAPLFPPFREQHPVFNL
jgi:hypothetical protein